jgi:hypothetical protein
MKRIFSFLLALAALPCSVLPCFAQSNNARMLSGVNVQAGSSYTFVPADATRLVVFSSAGGVAATLPSGMTSGFGTGTEFDAQNIGAGTVTLTCSGCLIFSNGAAGSATFTLGSGTSSGPGVLLFSAGLNYYALPTGGSGGASGLPGYSTLVYGTTGNGSTDDTTALQNAVNACPQVSPNIGCDIYLPAGNYKTTATINLALLKGVRLHGSGTCGIQTCSTTIQTNGAIYGFTIGTGTSPNTSGFIVENIGFQDMTGTGLGGIDVLATNSGGIWGVTCQNYFVGACVELDGGVNFTQFIDIRNLNFWHHKYGIQTSSKTASIFIWGGQGNCVNSGVTDLISGSVGIDIGYTNHSAGVGTGSEWSVDYQVQNCQIGIGLWNAGGNHFWGKAVENTFIQRPQASFGVVVDGDTSFVANGNVFEGVQVTAAGTGFYLKPNVANTTILTPIFNGTNGADLVVDSVTLGSTRIAANKRFTGLFMNLATIARSGNVVTAVTSASGGTNTLSIVSGTLVVVNNVIGGTTIFNGTFPTTSVSTNDITGVTTLTWAQTGANESGTINGGGCQGLGSCIGGLSTVLTSGVGTLEYTGDNQTQDITLNVPTLSGNQSALPTKCQASTSRYYFNGTHTVLCDAGNGILNVLGGPAVIFNGGQGNSYTPQPTTVLSGGTGNVNTAGTAVTWTGGTYFSTAWAGATISINFIGYTVQSVASQTSLTLTSTAGTQTGVPFSTSGITGVPPCSVSSAGVCTSSDDKNHVIFTNTGGSTLILPPPGIANGYPPNYSFTADYEPGSGSSFMSVTPAGATSLYGIVATGTATQFRGSSSATNFSALQGVSLYTDGTNWFAVSGGEQVPIDQIKGGLGTTPLTIQGGPWNAGGSGANAGQDIFFQGGSSNSTNGRGGDVGLISGSDSNDSNHGSARLIQTFTAGTSLAGKEGSIVRVCKDVTGTDCATVGALNSGSVRLTISGTDPGTTGSVGVGIVYTGNAQGSPVQVQMSGVFSTASTGAGALVESNCIAGQFFEIGGAGLDNGAGDCTYLDSPRRVGIALNAATGSIGAPGRVPIAIFPYGGAQQYSTVQAPIAAVTATTAVTNNTGTLQMYQVNAAISCRATAAGDTLTLNILWTDGSSTAQTLSGTALCTTLGANSWAQITQSVLVGNGQALQWSASAVTNTHASTWDVRVSVSAVR